MLCSESGCLITIKAYVWYAYLKIYRNELRKTGINCILIIHASGHGTPKATLDLALQVGGPDFFRTSKMFSAAIHNSNSN